MQPKLFPITSKCTFQKGNDILLNIATPILIGGFLYLLRYLFVLPSFIQNYFSDGLWAYAYGSVILIIWDRQVHAFWFLTAFLSTAIFEKLQQLQYIPGTGDAYDVLVYAVFFMLALSLNNYFKTTTSLNNIS